MATAFEKIFASNTAGQTPSTGSELAARFNANFDKVAQYMDTAVVPGTGAPTAAPHRRGQIYIDTLNEKVFIGKK